MLWLGIILSYVVIGHIVLLFFFGTISTLPMELSIPVMVPFIISITASLFPLDLEDKLDEDPRAGGKILVCGVGEFIAAFGVIYLIFWLGIQNLLAFLPLYLFVMTVLVPNMVLFFLIGGLFFTAGYRIRFAPISFEPVPPLPNRNRIIGLLISCILVFLTGTLLFPGRIVDFWTEIRAILSIILTLCSFGLGFTAAVLLDISSKNRYDPELMREIPEDRFLCPLCHTEISPSSYRCYKCNHLIPDRKPAF
jgi:hypothetical protein